MIARYGIERRGFGKAMTQADMSSKMALITNVVKPLDKPLHRAAPTADLLFGS